MPEILHEQEPERTRKKGPKVGRYVGPFAPLLTTPKDDPAQLPRVQDLPNIPAFPPPEAPARISKQSALVIEQRQLSDKETV